MGASSDFARLILNAPQSILDPDSRNLTLLLPLPFDFARVAPLADEAVRRRLNRECQMVRLALSIVTAFGILAGSASARTVLVTDLLSEQSEAAGRSVSDLGDITIYFSTRTPRPRPVEDLAQSPSPSRSATAALSRSRAPSSTITLVANEKVEFSNFEFSANGGALPASGAVMVNGVPYRFSDVGALVVSAPFVTLTQRGGQPFQFALISFDVNELDAPLPAAAFLMLAGLVGIGVAAQRRKKL
jgi:hypothetical protein